MRTALILLLLVPTILLAQDLIIPKQGNPISAYEVAIGDTYVFYQISLDTTAQTMRIAKNEILMIRKADGTVLNLTESTSAVAAQPAEEVVQEDRFPIVDIENYHGFLLQKGNCVYIPTDSPYDYERAGQEEFKRLMENRGYWKVVDKLEQAHFVALCFTRLEGPDCLLLYLRLRNEYQKLQSIIVDDRTAVGSSIRSDIMVIGAPSGESVAENVQAARTIINELESRLKFIYNGKITYCNDKKAWIIP